MYDHLKSVRLNIIFKWGNNRVCTKIKWNQTKSVPSVSHKWLAGTLWRNASFLFILICSHGRQSNRFRHRCSVASRHDGASGRKAISGVHEQPSKIREISPWRRRRSHNSQPCVCNQRRLACFNPGSDSEPRRPPFSSCHCWLHPSLGRLVSQGVRRRSVNHYQWPVAATSSCRQVQ